MYTIGQRWEYYTVLLCDTGYLYFLNHPAITLPGYTIDRYTPQWIDFYLATGLGFSLSLLWNHPIRINVIVASADWRVCCRPVS